MNKLWSNESILARETLLIPSNNDPKEIRYHVNKYQVNELYVRPETPEDGKRPKKTNKKMLHDPTEGGSDGELCSSLKENNDDEDVADTDIGVMKDFNEIISKADYQINTYKQQRGESSEAFKAFNDILTNIDKTIETHKNRFVCLFTFK